MLKLNIKQRLSSLPKYELSFTHSVLFIAMLTVFSLLLQMLMQLAFFSYIRNPVLVWCNGLPIFLLTMLLYLLTNRIWASYIPVGALHVLLLTINHYKLYFLDEPFKPIDIMLATEAMNISQNYTIIPHIEVVLCILIFVLASVFLCKNVKHKKVTLKIRIPLIVCTVALSFAAYFGIYTKVSFYNNIYISEAKKFNDAEVIREKGFLYSFLININSVTYPKPDGYSEEAVAALSAEYVSDEKKLPNVIAIMSEAFFDPQAAENIQFKVNPLEKYNALKKEAYYGEMIVPGFAGSTASTEFEFLTGMNISLIDKSMPVVYKTHITGDTYSLAQYFKDAGFATSAIHPGHNWFYNRQNVYRRMGFDRSLFLEDFDFTPEMVNYYTADSVTADLIIDDYKKHLASFPDTGYFNFTVTIQNHGPYISSTPGDELLLERPEGMSDELYNTINNYMLGLRDAADLLCEVKEFCETLSEPTVIVFFGDHLPFWDSELEGYREVGYDVSDETVEGIKRRYSTPYLICSNSAAKDMIRENGGKVLTGEGENISSNYLAGELFRYMNAEPDGFFGFVQRAQDSVSIISPQFMMNDGAVIEENGDISDLLTDYRVLQYYYLREYKR